MIPVVTSVAGLVSSTRGRVRYIKTGNRQINAALHRIAMTRLRDGAGQVYYRKRVAMGGPPMHCAA